METGEGSFCSDSLVNNSEYSYCNANSFYPHSFLTTYSEIQENRNDLPEVRFFDMVHSKSKIMILFQKWRVSMIQKRARKDAIHKSVFSPDFDKEIMADSLYQAKCKLTMLKTMRILKTEHSIEQASSVLKASLKHRAECKAFGIWKSQYYMSIMDMVRFKKQRIISSDSVRISDILKDIHESIAIRAELLLKVEKVKYNLCIL